MMGTKPTSVSQSYSGLEFKTHFIPSSIDQKKLKLQQLVQDTIILLIREDIQQRPHQRIPYWILYSRAICLNLRTTSAVAVNGTSAGDDGQGHDDEAAITSAVQNSSSTTAGAPAGHVLTYQQFIIKFRDFIIEKVQDLPPSRVAMKLFSVQLANEALVASNTIFHQMAAHTDMKLARIRINQILAKKVLPNEISDASLIQAISLDNLPDINYLPIYTVLFLNDLINLGCASASFTINDKRLLYLQRESMKLLEQLVTIFISSADPDATDISDQHKLLHQYVSQLLSTVRPALVERYSPDLLASSGNIIHDLIKGGFVTDKVASKRLVKAVLSFLDVTPENSTCTVMINVQVCASNEMSWELSIMEYIVNASNAANLMSISSEDISAEVYEAISSSIREYVLILSAMWSTIISDCTRIKLAQSDVKGEFDLRRGGLTYPAFMNMSNLTPYYYTAYPMLVNAIAICPSIAGTTTASARQLTGKQIFTLMLSLLDESTKDSTSSSKSILLIESFATLCMNDEARTSVSSEDWNKLLRHITTSILPADLNQTKLHLANLKLACAMIKVDPRTESLESTMIAAIATANVFFPELFLNQQSVDSSLVIPQLRSSIADSNLSQLLAVSIPAHESSPRILPLILDIFNNYSQHSTSISADDVDPSVILFSQMALCSSALSQLRSNILSIIGKSLIAMCQVSPSKVESISFQLLQQLFVLKAANYDIVAQAQSVRKEVVIKGFVDSVLAVWRLIVQTAAVKVTFLARTSSCYSSIMI
jgi:hypothetical protein